MHNTPIGPTGAAMESPMPHPWRNGEKIIRENSVRVHINWTQFESMEEKWIIVRTLRLGLDSKQRKRVIIAACLQRGCNFRFK